MPTCSENRCMCNWLFTSAVSHQKREAISIHTVRHDNCSWIVHMFSCSIHTAPHCRKIYCGTTRQSHRGTSFWTVNQPNTRASCRHYPLTVVISIVLLKPNNSARHWFLSRRVIRAKISVYRRPSWQYTADLLQSWGQMRARRRLSRSQSCVTRVV